MFSKVRLDYFHPNEAEQFTFYRIPKILFTDERYCVLSADAKILYGLMLDRMGLSLRNGWIDAKGHVFIYFTLEDSLNFLRCGHGKAIRLFAELDGIGLIKRKKQGQGRPAKVFVMNFSTAPEEAQGSDNGTSETAQTSDQKPADNPQTDSGRCEEVQPSEKKTSALPKTGSADFPKSDGSNTYVNHTEWSETDPSIHPAGAQPEAAARDDSTDAMDAYREIIKENIAYDILRQKCDPERLDEILNIMLETVCSQKKKIRIAGEDISAETVKSRLLKLDDGHIEYVLECLDRNTTDIRNIRSYLLTALYEAPTTINSYYAARVNHDLYSEPR